VRRPRRGHTAHFLDAHVRAPRNRRGVRADAPDTTEGLARNNRDWDACHVSALPALAWRTALASLEAAAVGVSGEDVSELAGRLEVLKLRLVLRLQTPAAAPAAEKGDDDRFLDAERAAALLGVKVSWIYDHSAEFSPIRLPGRLLRFSESKLRRWMRKTA
jgi:predicted DNA-binding transcriptional regulator AlpA